MTMTPEDYKLFWIWMAAAVLCAEVLIGLIWLIAFTAVARAIMAEAVRQLALLIGRG